MSVEALNCKECGERYPLDARFVCERCFGPLEVEYDLTGLDPDETRRRIQAGPATIWRYADFLPFETRPRTALAAGGSRLMGPGPRGRARRGGPARGRDHGRRPPARAPRGGGARPR